MNTLKEDFTKIYQKEKWGKGKGSGTGSTPLYCQKYLKYLQSLLQPGMHVLDLGCGRGEHEGSSGFSIHVRGLQPATCHGVAAFIHAS
jgi:2-polyprenyl-3-methyl-5-hydroxy-6-metoxy-1,4-benzoquinol methylase